MFLDDLRLKDLFEEIKNDHKTFGEVLQMEYFDDYIDGTRYIFRIEGDKIIIYIRNDVEKFEISFTMDVEFILSSSIDDCIKQYNECCYYAPNVYIEEV